MSMRDVITLCENAGTGNQADVTLRGGGVFVMDVVATFGGGSVKLQIKDKNGTYKDVAGSNQTANALSAGLFLPAGTYRVVNTTATAVFAYLYPVDQ